MYHWLDTIFTHLTVIGKGCYLRVSSKIHHCCLVDWATHTRHASLIHEFLRFTTKGIVGISRAFHSRQLRPILDSAIAINNCFYCSPDSHATFISSSRSDIPWVWGSTLSDNNLAIIVTADYPQVSLFRSS